MSIDWQQGVISRITSNIYLTDQYYDADFIRSLGIRRVLSIGGRREWPDDFAVMYAHLGDVSTAPINRIFASSFKWIDDGPKAGESQKKILIHCQAGISRSPTIVIAYLMWKLGMPYERAYAHVKRIRPFINPNPGFSETLKKFDIFLQRNKMLKEKI